MVDTYAQGRVPGHIHSGVGQEASFVGVLANYKEGDYYKRTHRLTAVPYMMGTSLDTFFGELLAKTTGNSGGRGGAIHIGELHTGDLGFSGTLGCDAAVGDHRRRGPGQPVLRVHGRRHLQPRPRL